MGIVGSAMILAGIVGWIVCFAAGVIYSHRSETDDAGVALVIQVLAIVGGMRFSLQNKKYWYPVVLLASTTIMLVGFKILPK